MPLSSWVSDKPHRIFLRFVCLLPIILFNDLCLTRVYADGVNLRGEFNYINTDTEVTNKNTGIETSNEFSLFNQRYNFDLSKTVFPYVTLQGGTLYEIENSKSTVEETETEFEEKLLRPFVALNLNNPIYRAGLTYRKTQIETEISDIPDTQDFREEFDAVLNVRQNKIPDFNIRYLQTHTYDDPETIDDLDKLWTFETAYTAWKKLRTDYLYSRIESEDRIRDSDTLQQTHSGRIEYTDNFFDNRLSLNTSYNIRYNKLEFPTIGDVESKIVSVAGVASIDDTPDDGPALSLNNGLIDGNFSVSTGIDIGLGGDETTLTNIGLDFGFPVNVDRIEIWVDRSLSLTVSSSFSWSVYTSPDNTDTSTWTLLTTVFPASFGIFENRFEIFIPQVTTRFIKVVTRPLSPVIPDAANFPNIFITEMEAFTTLAGETARNKETTVDHNYFLNLRGKVSAKTRVGYDLNYRVQKREPPQDAPTQERTELSNGIFLNHIFDKVFSLSARILRTDTELISEEIVDYSYSASLKADYIKNFGQSLTYSGTNIEEQDGRSYTNSILLRNRANLYRGWDAFLDTGFSWNKPLDRTREDSNFLRFGTDLQPNRKLNINMNYSYTHTKRPDEEGGDTTESQYNLQALYVPTDTLSLFARLTLTDREETDTNLQNYSLNWSPFPDGTLQFFFTYDETLRPEDDQEETIIGPSLKWTLGRHVFLDLAYSFIKSETLSQKTDSTNLNANLKIVY
jgi:hypothetical protein